MDYRNFLSVPLLLILLSCSPKSDGDKGSSTKNQKPQEAVVLLEPKPAFAVDMESSVVFVEGSLTLSAESGPQAISPDLIMNSRVPLAAGDLLSTGPASSAELSFASFATVRLLPATELKITKLRSEQWLDMQGKEAHRVVVELELLSGAVLSKVRRLEDGSSFILSTENGAASVRGTQFLTRYEKSSRRSLTRVAVQEGRVALLPKGPLMAGLLDGRETNPLAKASVSVAFAFAPSAGEGEEISVGSLGEAELEAAEEVYGAIFTAAQNTAANGIDLDATDTPEAFIAAPGSKLEGQLREALGKNKAFPLSEGNRELLSLLDHLQDPVTGYSKLPAALPLERLRSTRGGSEKKDTKPLYPNTLWTVEVSSKPLSEQIGSRADTLYCLDADGKLSAVSSEGQVKWQKDYSGLSFSSLDSTIALVSKEALLILDPSTGAESGRWTFDLWAGTPRSKPIPVPEGIALATPRGIAILRSENASLVREILVPDGLSSSPVLAGRDLVAVTGRGTLIVIDISSGTIVAELPALLGKNPFALRYRSGLVCASDRSGRLVILDMASLSLRWERDLGIGLLSEPELGPDSAYVWTTDHKLLRLSTTDGATVPPPVSNIESPPLLSDGYLYYGSSGGILVVMNAQSGLITKKIAIPEAQSIRPLMVDGTLFVGTRGGKLLKVDLGR